MRALMRISPANPLPPGLIPLEAVLGIVSSGEFPSNRAVSSMSSMTLPALPVPDVPLSKKAPSRTSRLRALMRTSPANPLPPGPTRLVAALGVSPDGETPSNRAVSSMSKMTLPALPGPIVLLVNWAPLSTSKFPAVIFTLPEVPILSDRRTL